ncbi:hypothetical protein OIU79_015448 [Salix purpurea]|uniref:Uncharacterized protein n=1 Tax=Salix purpurea TaxID=77065 RepID=A0A9Q0PCA7_SALPP|nr:hypothetical protein OIU79_015448 [Salix purpurea]
MPSVSGSSLDFLWLAAPPLSMGSPPIVPAAAHAQVPPVSSICNHGHHFLLEVCGAPIFRGISRCTATPWSSLWSTDMVIATAAATYKVWNASTFSKPRYDGYISPAMGQNGASLAGQPKMDSKSVPSPTPTSESIYHETRLNNQANPPPPASSEYIHSQRLW